MGFCLGCSPKLLRKAWSRPQGRPITAAQYQGTNQRWNWCKSTCLATCSLCSFQMVQLTWPQVRAVLPLAEMAGYVFITVHRRVWMLLLHGVGPCDRSTNAPCWRRPRRTRKPRLEQLWRWRSYSVWWYALVLARTKTTLRSKAWWASLSLLVGLCRKRWRFRKRAAFPFKTEACTFAATCVDEPLSQIIV